MGNIWNESLFCTYVWLINNMQEEMLKQFTISAFENNYS